MLEHIGIGVGDIAITMKQFQYQAGETIQGIVSLKLRRPTPARALRVGLRGSQRVVRLRVQPSGGSAYEPRKDSVFDFTFPLEGPGEFTSGHFPFEIDVPTAKALKEGLRAPDGVIGDLARAVAFVATPARFPMRWQVVAYLDMPWKLNLSTAVDVSIDMRASTTP